MGNNISVSIVMNTLFIFSDFREIKTEKQKSEMYERTFLTFLNDPNDEVFKKYFKLKKPLKRLKNVRCTVTGYNYFLISKIYLGFKFNFNEIHLIFFKILLVVIFFIIEIICGLLFSILVWQTNFPSHFFHLF